MGSSTIATSMSMTGTSAGADTTQNLDDLLEKHSNKILDKLLSKLSPQQRALLSDLQEGEEEETA
jgi:Mg/Co/Ni transporter MgtE